MTNEPSKPNHRYVPKITVVTVCFNSERTLRRTIQSVLGQTYKNIEFILVDGASKDQTLKIIEEYRSQLAVVISEKDQGIYDAMNKGWRAATGEYIHFLNSDDYYAHPQALEQMVSQMTEADAKHLVQAKLQLLQAAGPTLLMGKSESQMNVRFDLHGLHQPALLFPRQLFEQFGGFDISYRISSDYELIRRFYEKVGARFIDQLLVQMSEGGASHQQVLRGANENKIIAKKYGESSLSVEYYFRRSLALHFLREKVSPIFYLLKAARDWAKNGFCRLEQPQIFSSEEGSWIDADLKMLNEERSWERLRPGFHAFGQIIFFRGPLLVWFLSVRVIPYLWLARLFGRKIFLIAGGFDVIDAETRGEKKSNLKLWLRRLTSLVAHRVFAVSQVTEVGSMKNLRIKPERMQRIPIGFDVPKLALKKSVDRSVDVISIFNSSDSSWSIKGLDVLIEIAAQNPELQFQHMGLISEAQSRALISRATSNIHFLGPMEYGTEKFWSVLGDSRILLQPSRFESFCAAAVEGALSGCQVLVSDRGELPETVRGFGETFSLENLAQAREILKRMSSASVDVELQRQKAAQKFALSHRKSALIQAIFQ